MELPFVFVDPHEQNTEIATVGTFLAQARRILANYAVSDEMKKSIFEVSMECIDNVKRYYQAKEKEAQLTKRDAELDEKLHQVERELAVKENTNNGLRASISEKKLKIQLSQVTIERSRERTRELLRERNELEKENKRLAEQAERNSAAWTASLQIACEQKDRLKTLMDRSPRIARQNNERDAVSALSNRLERLQTQKDHLQIEEGRIRKELELQTATPLRVFMVNFVKVTLRTLEMQEKLREAKKVYEQLKNEDAERRKKSDPSEYDVFDASFMSQDFSLRKVMFVFAFPFTRYDINNFIKFISKTRLLRHNSDDLLMSVVSVRNHAMECFFLRWVVENDVLSRYLPIKCDNNLCCMTTLKSSGTFFSENTRDDLHQTELPSKVLPSVPEAAEDESGSAEAATSENSRHSPPAQPPQTSSQDIIMARTAAINNYVTQQSESVAGGLAIDIFM
ncbi:hypothetical protein Y032_0012g1627 [Ancylostoma ceylanicum]|uniref:Uncharacterized protein n=1 Tax=Ancylostoma ceylanicum TaxID=53326 RepID=A0A016VE28_9BILA|nr:hypothetical protein Y032_0012g1627 [Ancylostoma ceylanicum]